MGSGIVRLVEDPEPLYVIWSTVVDAPVTFLMTRDELREFVIEDAVRRARESATRDFPGRMDRVDTNGTSFYTPPYTVDDMVSYNRAGPDETELPTAEAIADYLRQLEAEEGD